MTIEIRFDIPLIAAMALKEKQIQQNYRPIIAVHKWFARRPGLSWTPGGGSLHGRRLSASRSQPRWLRRAGLRQAARIVREEIEHLDLAAYRAAADSLLAMLADDIGTGYRTNCPLYGDRDVPVKYFLWVKTIDCERCAHQIDLFPGHLLAEDTRHPKHVLVCGPAAN
jgi:hypothetical protein